MSVTPSQFELLGGLLDAASLRHRVIAQNVANVNTPGYRRLDVSFEETLSREVLENGTANGSRQQPRIIEGTSSAEREDGNNVDIDAEMGRLNKNTMLYNVYSQILASRMAAMRSAITGR
jgi:flagellar basal-body rod protein FlgB